MKGKRWELPQKFRTIYWQNFALTASIVMLTLALLGASFFALSYAYAADERSDEMAQKASVVARLVASYASSGDVRDMREMAGVHTGQLFAALHGRLEADAANALDLVLRVGHRVDGDLLAVLLSPASVTARARRSAASTRASASSSACRSSPTSGRSARCSP